MVEVLFCQFQCPVLMKLITSTSYILDIAVENQSPSSEDAQAASPLERVHNQHKIASHKIESFYKYIF